MSAFKKALIVIGSLVFGTVFLLVTSYIMAHRSTEAVSASASQELQTIETDGIEKIDLTVELGKVKIEPSDSNEMTVTCHYPTKDYLDNKVKIIVDRDKETLNLRVSSKRKAYFFGLIKDKACDITIALPNDLMPDLSVKIQAGELMVGEVELTALSIDGDIADIEIQNPGVKTLSQIRVSNNLGNITAYLSNLKDRTHPAFHASVNVGEIDLHLKTADSRGYRLGCVYNIGKLETNDHVERGFGKNETYLTGQEQKADYWLKVDVGRLFVFEDKE